MTSKQGIYLFLVSVGNESRIRVVILPWLVESNAGTEKNDLFLQLDGTLGNLMSFDSDSNAVLFRCV